MVNTYAVQSGGCRFEPLWGFGFFLKGAHYEVDYSGKKTYLAGLQCTLTSCAKNSQSRNFQNGASRARKTLQKFVYSALRQMRALFRTYDSSFVKWNAIYFGYNGKISDVAQYFWTSTSSLSKRNLLRIRQKFGWYWKKIIGGYILRKPYVRQKWQFEQPHSAKKCKRAF